MDRRAADLRMRNMNMESLYEYGSRAGFWRLYRAFTQRDLPVTVYAVAMALERNPPAVAAMVAAGWEMATHGYRWRCPGDRRCRGQNSDRRPDEPGAVDRAV